MPVPLPLPLPAYDIINDEVRRYQLSDFEREIDALSSSMIRYRYSTALWIKRSTHHESGRFRSYLANYPFRSQEFT
jgi:hypothetical protein